MLARGRGERIILIAVPLPPFPSKHMEVFLLFHIGTVMNLPVLVGINAGMNLIGARTTGCCMRIPTKIHPDTPPQAQIPLTTSNLNLGYFGRGRGAVGEDCSTAACACAAEPGQTVLIPKAIMLQTARANQCKSLLWEFLGSGSLFFSVCRRTSS